MNYTIYTRSRSEELYGKMLEFLPKEANIKPVTGFDGYYESVEYLLYIINDCQTDYIVNIDEDCFIYDFSEVEKIISDLEKLKLTHAGMSDFGACPHRNFRQETHNPFFNVINAEFAKKTIMYDLLECEEFEPFDKLFYNMYKEGRHYHLGVKQYDEISTELIHNKPFCIHTWYSRDYEIDGFHKKRIIEAYEYAKSKQVWK